MASTPLYMNGNLDHYQFAPPSTDLTMPSLPVTGRAANPTEDNSIDAALRLRLGMRAAGEAGSQISQADLADGEVGIGSAIGSGLSGAAGGAQIGSMLAPGVGTGVGAGIGAAVGLGTSLYAMYEQKQAKAQLAKERKRRERQIWLQQKQWLAKNKDALALQDKIDMEALNAKFNEQIEQSKRSRSMAGYERMKAITDAINQARTPVVEALTGIY